MLPDRLCARPSLLIRLWPLANRGHNVTASRYHRCITTMRSQPYNSVFELAADWPAACASAGHNTDNIINRVLQVTADEAQCRISEPLKAKYGAVLESQQVVSFTNRVTHEQAWFNAARSRKPQTFADGEVHSMLNAVAALDTTGGPSGGCDFCQWDTNTAEDTFGRIEVGNVVSASNLFKYCAPAHGLLLFKHHNPLAFTAADVQQLLLAGSRWFDAAAATAVANNANDIGGLGDIGSDALSADGAGATAPSEKASQLTQQASSRFWPLLLWNNLPRAGASQFHGHAQTALSEVPFPSDLHMMQAAASYEALHSGACYYDDVWHAHATLGLAHEYGTPDDRVHIYASLTPRKDAEMIIHGCSLTSPSFALALHAALRVVIDDLECPAFNAAVQPTWDCATRASMAVQPFSSCRVVARVVSRGKVTSRSSDIGALEVFAGASIGHTDPHVVQAAISRRLSALGDKPGLTGVGIM